MMDGEVTSPLDAFKKLVELFASSQPAVGRIKKGTVDEKKGTCQIVTGTAKINRVFLNVISNPDLLLIPDYDSYVVYTMAPGSNEQAYILACSKIRKIILKTSPAGTVTFDLSDSGVEVKAGANGRVKIADAGTEIGTSGQPQVRGTALQAWAQNVDTAIAALITWGATGQAPGPAGGIAPLTGVTPTTFASTILSSKNKVE